MKNLKLEIEIGENLSAAIRSCTFDSTKQEILEEVLQRFDKELLKIIKKDK